MAFELPPLPYDYDALEPVISKETMTFHHDKHHKTYTDKLNEALEQEPTLKGLALEQIFAHMSSAPAAIRNNGGGYWNHDFFWKCMTGEETSPSGVLAQAIDRDFGGLDALKTAFNAKGAGQFGSGWAWLIADADGKLKVTSTANQDNPLMDLVAERGVPILVNDVWEHAYYLSFRNDRAAYLQTWWSIVDWDAAGKRYEVALAR